MHVITEINKPLENMLGAVVALGNFDGVHKGHQVVLAKARDMAQAMHKPFGVVTFEPHPRSIFFPADAPFRLTPPATKRRILAEMGVDVVFEIPFTYDFSKVSAQDFIEKILLHNFTISHAVAGHDFVFGHKRGGTMYMLRDMLQQHGIKVDEIAPVMDAAHTLWSSTRIRDDLVGGFPKKAADALGRYWEIEGKVLHGAQRGRALGFPTANMALGEFLRPRYGVYAITATHAGKTHKGVANIGIRPTVDGEAESLEAHLFDFNGDLYGAEMRVALVDFIRPEQRFNGLDALKAQISEDCLVARQMLS